MSMPQIPENKNRPDFKCVVIDLLESIALEEVALSHLLNAEAEKMQAFVGEKLNFPFKPTIDEILEFNKTSIEFVDKIIMKEWILMNKLKKILDLDKICKKCDKKEICNEKNCSEMGCMDFLSMGQCCDCNHKKDDK